MSDRRRQRNRRQRNRRRRRRRHATRARVLELSTPYTYHRPSASWRKRLQRLERKEGCARAY